jgi:hypothetical protein
VSFFNGCYNEDSPPQVAICNAHYWLDHILLYYILSVMLARRTFDLKGIMLRQQFGEVIVLFLDDTERYTQARRLRQRTKNLTK